MRPDRSLPGEREKPQALVAPERAPSAPHLPVEVLARMPVSLPGRGGGAALAALVRSAGPALGNRELQRAIRPGRAPSGNVLARRLIATGDVDRFRAMAEPASGLLLSVDPATNEVTAIGSLVDPATSPSFATQLTNIMDDPLQDAEAHFGAGQPGVLGGAFPQPSDLTGPTVQTIDMDDMEGQACRASASRRWHTSWPRTSRRTRTCRRRGPTCSQAPTPRASRPRTR